MLNVALVFGVLLIALLVGQSYPIIGGLIATFPTKVVGFAVGSGENIEVGLRALLLGSAASLACVIAMTAMIGYGVWPSVICGLAMWGLVALVGRLLFA